MQNVNAALFYCILCILFCILQHIICHILHILRIGNDIYMHSPLDASGLAVLLSSESESESGQRGS